MNAPATPPRRPRRRTGAGAPPQRALIVEWPRGSVTTARRIARWMEARGARRAASGVYWVDGGRLTEAWVARLARVLEARGGRLVVANVNLVDEGSDA